MTARIRVWSTGNLSYMARAQLINLVLISLRRYWAQVCVLPKEVLREVLRYVDHFHGVVNTLAINWDM